MTGTGPGGPSTGRAVSVTGVPGLPEIGAGDDLAGLIADAAPDLADGDIVVITSKIVSKAEGRVIRADRDKAIDAETVRVVARRGPARIVETQHGLVLAAAGVDDSNTAPGTVALLPADPDDSARRIRRGLRDRRGVTVGGGDHRHDGAALADGPGRRGHRRRRAGPAARLPRPGGHLRPDAGGDGHGRRGRTGVGRRPGQGQAGQHPRGRWSGDWPTWSARPTAPARQALIRPAAEDMFRYGASEVLTARRTVREFTADPVDAEAVRRAIAAALTAPAPHHSTPCRFVVLSSAQARTALLDDMLAAWISDLRGGRVHRGADRPAGPARRAAAPRSADHRAVPGRRRGARLPGRAARGRRAGDVRGGGGGGGAEPPGRAGRGGPGLVLGVQHHVLPAGRGGRPRPAGRLGADGRGRRGPPGGPGPGSPPA